MAADLPEILSASEVGLWLGVSSKQVRRLAAEKKLPGIKVGEQWRFSRTQLLAWLESGAA